MLDALEKLLNNIQSGMSARSSFIENLQQAFTSLYSSATQSYSQLDSSILG
jgi:hypothetical protein